MQLNIKSNNYGFVNGNMETFKGMKGASHIWWEKRSDKFNFSN